MIRINLLPVRAAKKKETAQRQIVIFVSCVIAVLVVMGLLYSMTISAIAGAKKEISASEGELAELKKKIGEIDNVKKLQEEVKRKLDILTELRKGKTGPVDRMVTLTEVVPDQVWLTSYNESGGSISISAVAMNEDLIAEFIRRLEASKEYENVELLVSEQSMVGGEKMKSFSISCSIQKQEPPKPTEQKK